MSVRLCITPSTPRKASKSKVDMAIVTPTIALTTAIEKVPYSKADGHKIGRTFVSCCVGRTSPELTELVQGFDAPPLCRA
jgi:hypothetical protein